MNGWICSWSEWKLVKNIYRQIISSHFLDTRFFRLRSAAGKTQSRISTWIAITPNVCKQKQHRNRLAIVKKSDERRNDHEISEQCVQSKQWYKNSSECKQEESSDSYSRGRRFVFERYPAFANCSWKRVIIYICSMSREIVICASPRPGELGKVIRLFCYKMTPENGKNTNIILPFPSIYVDDNIVSSLH